MSKSRIKAAATVITSREEMERLVGQITQLKITEQTLTAEMNEKIAAVRGEYEADLGVVSKGITAKMALARDWAEANAGEFGKAKSIAMTHGDVGWRIGNPSLKTLSGWTWARVLEKLQAGGVWLKYVRTTPEVDKQQLLADRNEIDLKDVGCRVVQEEAFFIEPRIETPETRVQEAAS